MSKAINDILGNELKVGDEVAVAFPSGRSSAKLRVGKIIGFTEKPTEVYNYHLGASFPGPPKFEVEIEWDKDKSGGYLPSKKATKLENTSGRFVKLN
jgi:hypothetical protein